MAGKITGRVSITLNGVLLLNKAGAVASGIGISGAPAFERAPVQGDTGLHGFTETPIVAVLEVTVTDRDDISLSEIAKVNGDGTIVFATVNGGKVYTMGGATCLMNFSVTSGEGETPLTFNGPSWTEGTSLT